MYDTPDTPWIHKYLVTCTCMTLEMGGHTLSINERSEEMGLLGLQIREPIKRPWSIKIEYPTLSWHWKWEGTHRALMRDEFFETTDKRTNEATLIHEDWVSHTFLTLEMKGHISSINKRSEEMSLWDLQIREPMKWPWSVEIEYPRLSWHWKWEGTCQASMRDGFLEPTDEKDLRLT